MKRETVAALRFGFGLPLPAGAAVVPEAMLAALAGPDLTAEQYPTASTAEVLLRLDAFDDAARDRRRARRASAGGAPEAIEQAYKAAGQALNDGWLDGARAIIARALDAPDGFRERLALFWADHFTVSVKTPSMRELPLALMADAIRPNLAGSFADLLTAVETHPAMLIYLDQVVSVGPNSVVGKRKGKGLNENLAREMMELHTLGVGAGYTQDDVRQLAELLTGMAVQPGRGFRFLRQRAEPGAEQVLGESYPEVPQDGMVPIKAVLADLTVRPETARHMAKKLAVHFVSDEPDASLVEALETAWMDSGGQLMMVYAALLAHPTAWQPTGPKVRPPVEFVVASLRALGIGGAQVMGLEDRAMRRLLLQPMTPMGQPWQAPGGPDGWPELAADWITPQGLAARIGWAMDAPSRLAPNLPDPRDFVMWALDDAANKDLIWAAGAAENRAEGVGLVLASPAFNRR
ncbi:MAG: DUF1800 domain-containing protein [Cereibacter sphaeroides]|uniref:DUF1800 domain-containing protein n=1 Tax=Cereibacter sphaeroides TaxID=1063 RepID=A0A2W5TJH7_CERSP|nr:MAG: DUF1800 domain-containing protein [Cereibacter sphaeroides]